MKSISTTLIITTYNWPVALELCLLSVKEQTVLPNEVIIADDGSTNETKKLIAFYQKDFPINIVHIWHQDKGFRLSKIRNKAIAVSKSDYIVQIDGDLILHKNFIKDHINYSRKGVYLTGSRVWLSKELSLFVQQNKMLKFKAFTKGFTNTINGFYFPFLTRVLKNTTENIHKAVYKVRGCNMSFWKEDLLAVNGYDEEMVDWGREDSDLSVRLVHLGLKKERVKFGAIQYHQDHPLNSKLGVGKNDQILKKTIATKKIKCKKGLSAYL